VRPVIFLEAKRGDRMIQFLEIPWKTPQLGLCFDVPDQNQPTGRSLEMPTTCIQLATLLPVSVLLASVGVGLDLSGDRMELGCTFARCRKPPLLCNYKMRIAPSQVRSCTLLPYMSPHLR